MHYHRTPYPREKTTKRGIFIMAVKVKSVVVLKNKCHKESNLFGKFHHKFHKVLNFFCIPLILLSHCECIARLASGQYLLVRTFSTNIHTVLLYCSCKVHLVYNNSNRVRFKVAHRKQVHTSLSHE